MYSLIEKYEALLEDVQLTPPAQWDSVDWACFNMYTEILEDLRGIDRL